MKSISMAIIGMLVTSFAHAGQVKTASAQTKGINESITIEKMKGGLWGNSFTLQGFYSGTGVNKLVPVTREAATVLQSLDATAKYNCVILNSTYVAKNSDNQLLGATYYVLDINCD